MLGRIFHPFKGKKVAMRTTGILVFLLSVWLSAIPRAQISVYPAKKVRTEVEERIYLEEEVRASHLSHHLAEGQDRKRNALLSRFRIQAGMDPCLAYNRPARECIVYVEDFNAAVATYLPDSFDSLLETQFLTLVRKARGTTLETLLEKAYLREMSSMGPIAPSASVRKTAFAEGNVTDSLLKVRFRKYFPALLALDAGIRVKVFASSDSSILDSLIRTEKGRMGLNTYSLQSLPEGIALDLLGTRPGFWTRIRKVPFGFLSLSPVTPPPTPADCRRILSDIENQAAPAETDRDQRAREFFHSHREDFRTRDTLELCVRLVPARKAVGEPGSDGNSVSPKATGAMAAEMEKIAPVCLESIGLPPAIAAFVEKRFQGAHPDSVGPVRLEYGIWTFAFLGRKPGQRLLTFEEAKTLINVRMDALVVKNLIRQAMDRLRTKLEAETLVLSQAALIENLRESKPHDDAFKVYVSAKLAWITENIQIVYSLED